MEGAKELLKKAGFDSLPDGWDAVQIKDLISNNKGISVGVMYPGEHTPEGVPLIRSADLNGSIINDRPSFKISLAKHTEYRRTELEGGELVMSLVGTISQVGQCAVVPKSMAGWNTARAVAVIRLKDASNAAYVRAVLLSPPLRRLMISWSNSTAQTTLNLKEIKQLPIPWPPIEARLSIAHVLTSINDKIALNRRMNQTLEQLAQTIFRQWFVAFDFPNVEGKPYRSSGGALVDSELGEIPERWQIGKTHDAFTTVGGGTPSTSNPGFWEGGDIPWTTPKDLTGVASPVMLDPERRITNAGLSKISSGLLPTGTLLLSSRAPIGYLAITQLPVAINQGYIALNAKGYLSNLYMLFWLKQYMEVVKGRANGTTFQEISKGSFREIQMILPDVETAFKFDQVAQPLFDRIVANEIQSRTLATLRDTLLPQLLSGRLMVRQSEELMA